MSIEVLAPGLLTSVQDAGRQGWRALGVGSAGVLDPYSATVANLLVGNPADAAVLEITLGGPRLRFRQAASIALCGARIDADIDATTLPGWRRIHVPAESTLNLGACREGARAYLAIGGGLRIEHLLGSASTDLRAGFGGLGERALQRGDVLAMNARPDTSDSRSVQVERRWIDPSPDLDFSTPALIYLLEGKDALAEAQDLNDATWQVGTASNRQGLRLSGPALSLRDTRERLSAPVWPGTLQLPPDGQPILLLADAQTHGGYPCIGHVIQADFPRLAQLRPGATLRFARIDAEGARQRRLAQRQRLARIAIALGT